MYAIKFTSSYKKDFKRLIMSGRSGDVEKLEKVVTIIASGEELDKKYKNHFLSGKLKHFQECHIKDDLLLIYMKNKRELILVLISVGSHSDLFG